jgi:hypothetical protein
MYNEWKSEHYKKLTQLKSAKKLRIQRRGNGKGWVTLKIFLHFCLPDVYFEDELVR